jgi:ATP-dependent Clp protease ATP-binding subunit ClpA
VNFERAMIFLSSNLGAASMRREMTPDFGFEAAVPETRRRSPRKLDAIGLRAVKRRFSPEFVNRIDAVVTYRPLDSRSLEAILDQQLAGLEKHLAERLGERAFQVQIQPAARRFLLEQGTSAEYGARELKRTILRHLTQPLAALLESGQVEPEAVVRVDRSAAGDQLAFTVE